MRFIFFLILMSLSSILYTQVKYDYNWIYANDINSSDGFINGSRLYFGGEDTLVSDGFDALFEINTTNATMSDAAGNLLFYTNGCEIANRNHQLMMNGDSINPGEFHDFTCNNGYSAIGQSCLVLPYFEEDTYMIIHQSTRFDDDFTLIASKILYTLVDMTGDNGLGAVTEKNVLIHEDEFQSGQMTAIKHSNGEDWWLVNSKHTSDIYFTYLIKADTIEGPFPQPVGIVESWLVNGGGGAKFSPDGTRFAVSNANDQLSLFDFDRSTGELYNFQLLHVGEDFEKGTVAFSASSRFLYVNTKFELYQFDVEEEDIQSSKVLVGETEGCVSVFPAAFWQMELGPDCRIYMNGTSSVEDLHVIQHPDVKGVDCDFRQCHIPLVSSNQFSMPHFPYYRMDTGEPICNPDLIVSSTEVPLFLPKEAKVYPNPANREVTIVLDENIQGAGQIILRNQLGQTLLVQNFQEGEVTLQLDVSQLPTSLYYLSIEQEGVSTKVTPLVIKK